MLLELKHCYNVVGIKAEFENEGSRQVELMRLKDIASVAELPLLLKIGGCEAVTDMYEALSIGAVGIVAPMVETPFAVKKYIDAIKKFIPEDNKRDIHFGINIETITSVNNIEDILSLSDITVLDGITFGRVDFVGSMQRDRSVVNDFITMTACKKVFKKAFQYGLGRTLGGAIAQDSYDFINELAQDCALQRYETRKIVFNIGGLKTFKDGLDLAVRFELEWLKSKKRYYHRISQEDEKRIAMIEGRVNG